MTISGLPPLSKPIIRHECLENLLSDSITYQGQIGSKDLLETDSSSFLCPSDLGFVPFLPWRAGGRCLTKLPASSYAIVSNFGSYSGPTAKKVESLNKVQGL